MDFIEQHSIPDNITSETVIAVIYMLSNKPTG